MCHKYRATFSLPPPPRPWNMGQLFDTVTLQSVPSIFPLYFFPVSLCLFNSFLFVFLCVLSVFSFSTSSQRPPSSRLWSSSSSASRSHYKSGVKQCMHVCMADSWKTRVCGRLMVSFLVWSVFVGGCRVRFWTCRPYRTLDRPRFGLRMIGMLLALSASCLSPVRLHASLPRSYVWLFSLMSANCFALRPPAAMTDG